MALPPAWWTATFFDDFKHKYLFSRHVFLFVMFVWVCWKSTYSYSTSSPWLHRSQVCTRLMEFVVINVNNDFPKWSIRHVIRSFRHEPIIFKKYMDQLCYGSTSLDILSFIQFESDSVVPQSDGRAPRSHNSPCPCTNYTCCSPGSVSVDHFFIKTYFIAIFK